MVELDQVFSLTARAVERVVEIFGVSFGEVGDDKADIEPQWAGLDPRGDPALLLPRPGDISRLSIAPYTRTR